jgi:TetR/AcrR family transcriptional repressor of mexJK operon
MKSQKHKNTREITPPESAKRARILEVAGQMFVSQGYSAVSMDALAEAAPVSKPTLYKHFKDKKALFSAVIQARCDGMFDRFEHCLNGSETDPETVLKDMAGTFLDLILSPQPLAMHRVIVAEAQTFPELGQMFYETGPKRVMALLADWLNRQHKDGRLVIGDPALSASLFLNMIKTELHLQCLLGLKKSVSKAERSRVVNYAVDVFIRAHLPENLQPRRNKTR